VTVLWFQRWIYVNVGPDDWMPDDEQQIDEWYAHHVGPPQKPINT